jgi:thiol-disulfide isomerase/thioredoxin
MKSWIFLFVMFLTTVISSAKQELFMNDSKKAFALAKKNKNVLMIDFYGIWCPPCNEMNETVFESKAFLQKAKEFTFLKVDVDSKGSWKLKDRFNIGGYPTYVFTTSEGKEIYRVVGSRPLKEFMRILDLVLAAKDKDLSKACASETTDDLWRCAVICSEREDKACAEKAYTKLESSLKPGTARYDLARTYSVENAGTIDLKRDGYERLMKEFPSTPMAMSWATEYMDLFATETRVKPKMELVDKVLSNYSQMLKDPRRAELGLDDTDIAENRAQLLEHLGKVDEAKAAWKEAAVMFEQKAKELPPDAPARGFNIERIACLNAAGDVNAALKLANEYRDKYPDEFTFHFWATRILNGAKKYPEAALVAKKMYATSYGDNRIRAAALYVEILAALSDKEGAKRIYDDVMKENHPDQKLQIRTHRYLKALEETYKKVAS